MTGVRTRCAGRAPPSRRTRAPPPVRPHGAGGRGGRAGAPGARIARSGKIKVHVASRPTALHAVLARSRCDGVRA